MQIVVEHHVEQLEVDLGLEEPGACVDDLVRAVDAEAAEAGAGVVIDGRLFGPEEGLDEIGLYEGAVASIATRAPDPSSPPAGPVLLVLAGRCAGTLHRLGATTTVGRDAADVVVDDPTVSAPHCAIEADGRDGFVVRDLGSRNGTWVDGEAVTAPTAVEPGAMLRLGAVHLRVVCDLPADRPVAVDPLHSAAGGLVPFNRPPRAALPPEPAAVDAPKVPQPKRRSRAFSIAMIIGPLLMGSVLVLVFQRWYFAIFMLLSPVMAVGNWLSSRRQTKKDHATSTKEFHEELDRFDRELGERRAEEVARRERVLPDLAETLRRVHQPSTTLWQRRTDHPDFLRLRAGTGDVPWTPPVNEEEHKDADRELLPRLGEVRDRHRVLPACPVEIDLSAGGVVGVVGQRDAALDLARALLVQAAAHHGPADLGVAVLASGPHAADWDWAKWLPHTRDERGAARLIAGEREVADQLVGGLLHTAGGEDRWSLGGSRGGEAERGGRTRLYVVDDVALLRGRRAPTRRLLRGEAGPAAGIVVAETEDQLPAVTTTVVELRSEIGDADLRRPQFAERVDGLVIGGLAEHRARDAARTLARYEDPELELVGAGLPTTVRLLPLLGMDDIDAHEVRRAWKEGLPDPAPNAPIGVGEDGPIHLDLARDGPHGLVGGTTGSGKSELLRSVVAGMAARVDPEHLVFVLVDYKGGSAFDLCAQLPHTVGLVTDLDEHLGERALVSLEAELGHRERLLRQAGAQDLSGYLRAGAQLGPLPRLLVVVDEFATLAAELPDFLGALVGIAQRGRSLGVHLILATQRPSGAVNANIKANTNLRVALRVQDEGDSRDIIDRPDAAAISRATPGRAYVRLGPGDVAIVQTPLSTAAAEDGQRHPVRLGPFPFAPTPPPPPRPEAGGETPSDLARLVHAAGEAFAHSGAAAPRKPWLPMLPERLGLDDAAAHADDDTADIAIAVADHPERQRQAAFGWQPEDGHMALFGMVGSGTTTALRTVARAVAEGFAPDEFHLYALDFGAGGLAPLASLPHVGAVVPANDGESQQRLVRELRQELDRRRDLDAAELARQPRLAVLIDGIGGFLAEYESAELAHVADTFRRVFADGAAVGICFVVAGSRVGELPMRLSSATAQKLLFRLADSNDYTTAGLRSKKLPEFVPGRAVDAGSQRVVQLAHPGDDGELRELGERLSTRHEGRAGPKPLRTMPAELAHTDLPEDRSGRDGDVVRLTIGVADEDLGPAELELDAADHALVAGPPRSGKSSLLALLAHQLRRADPETMLVGLCQERSPLRAAEPALDGVGSLEGLERYLRLAVDNDRRWVVLVDDATRLDDADGIFQALLRCGRPGLHVVAAARSDELRSAMTHWTRGVRQSRTGVLLQPDLSRDGDLLGLNLPRRVPVALGVGRGFVVAGGVPALVQVATPPPSAEVATREG